MPEVTDPRLLVRLNQGTQVKPANPKLPGELTGQSLNNANAAVNAQVNQATQGAQIREGNAKATKAEQEARVARQEGRNPVFDREKDLRSAFEAQPAVQAYKDAATALGIILKTPDNGGGDIQVIYNFIKAQGPGPVAQGELDLAGSVASLREDLERKYGKITDSNRLPARVRRELIESARQSVAAKKLQFDQVYTQFRSEAERNGLNAQAITGKHPADAIRPIEESYIRAHGGTPRSALTGNPVSGLEPAGAGATATARDFPDASAFTDAAVRQGMPFGEWVTQLESRFGAPEVSMKELSEQYRQAQDFHKQNPGYRGSYGRITLSEPLSSGGQQLNDYLHTPEGAFVANAANSATAGIPTMIAGDQGRMALDYVGQQHPTASFLGETTGAIAGSLGAGGIAGQAAQMGGLTGRAGSLLAARGGLGADTLYGATYGASQDENALRGAAIGGASALGGNLLGQGATAALGGAISPTGGGMRTLYDMGVRPSLGQRFPPLNSVEEFGMSLPVIGSFIRGTRDTAREQAKRGIFNDALGEVGEKLPDNIQLGPPAHQYKQAVEDRVYDAARSNMQMVPDGQFGADLGAVQRTVSQLPETSAKRFSRIWNDEVVRRMQNGQLSGDAYKKAQSNLGKSIRKMRGSDPELADALKEMSMTLDGAARRSSPTEAAKALDDADRMYAKGVLIDRASGYAGGDMGDFTPSAYLRAVQAEGGGVRNRQFNAGNALNQDLAQQFSLLRDAQPNSTTAERVMHSPLGIGGTVALNMTDPTGATQLATGLTGAYGLLNAPGIRKLTTEALAPRKNESARILADTIRRQQLLAGRIGGGAGLVAGPSVPAWLSGN